MIKFLAIGDEAPIRDKIVTVLKYENYEVIDAPTVARVLLRRARIGPI